MNVHLLLAAALVAGSTAIGNGAEGGTRSEHCPKAESRADKNVERACGDHHIKECKDAVDHQRHIAEKCTGKR